MNSEWEKIDQLFHQALETSDEARGALLAQHDPALRQELQSLLDVHDTNDSFLETPAMRVNLAPHFGQWQEQIATALAPATPGQMIGRLLDGKYQLEELCGRGGMGAVYRATHVGTGRRVAVKVIAPELAGQREFIERFQREAKTIGRLRHPNIVNVTDFGITGDNEQTLAYLVMEHLDGCTLATKLKDKRPLPLADALDILNQTCAAIDEAHRLGILHRDLKPENIWLEPVGTNRCNVKVLDFGIAQLQDWRLLDQPEPQPLNSILNSITSESINETGNAYLQPLSITEDDTLRMNLTLRQLTRAGTVLGTPKYMSPEQTRGEKLDKCSDVYSLGVIAYQMLSGDVPFNGTAAEVLQQHREAAPLPLSQRRLNLSDSLDAVIAQALAKEPSARPATAGAFAFRLGLQPLRNDWLREQTDALHRKHRFKLMEMAVRLQWPSLLVTGVLLMTTVFLPGLRPLPTGIVFGLLWLAMTAVTFWQQNKVTAAFTLWLDKARDDDEPDVRNVVKQVKRRSGAFARAPLTEAKSFARKLFTDRKGWADSLLLVPALMQEGLSVDEAAQRSSALSEPLRGKLGYPMLRRLLAGGLTLTAWQVMMVVGGHRLDERFNDTPEVIFTALIALLTMLLAFSFNLKSSLEQAALYHTARQALGEDIRELSPRPIVNHLSRWWPLIKTYAPTCALLALTCYLQFIKFPVMSDGVNRGDIHTVKALQATGVPLPIWSLDSSAPRGWRRYLRKILVPFGKHDFDPYGESTLGSPEMREFLWEKGFRDVNTRLVLRGDMTPLKVGTVTMTPLHLALTLDDPKAARWLIARNADLHARDSLERTPLIVALTYCPSAIEPLLKAGANRDELTRFGPSLLAAARYQWLYRVYGVRPSRLGENENAVKILLAKGVDPNTHDSFGRNALMVMSMEQRIGYFTPEYHPDNPVREASAPNAQAQRALQLIGEALLQAGCDINAADSEGRTPLMYAVRYQQPAAVRLLLERGAQTRAKDNGGMTAFDLARQSRNDEIIGVLQPENAPGRVPVAIRR